MPAKKKGKGGRKKSTAAKKPPPKTPAGPKGSSAPGGGSKRKGKNQSLVSSVPRRVSPRLLEKRKMQENGFERQLVMIGAQGNEHDQSSLKASRNGKKRVVEEDKSVEDDEEHGVAEGGETGDREDSQEGKDDPEQEEELDQAVFERGGGGEKELEVVTIDVPDAIKEAEERLENHAVVVYFTRGELTMTRELVKEWIHSVVGDRETIGSIQCCRDLGRGFFLVVFELAEARRAALAAKPRQFGLQVTVFPWCAATVNAAGEQCSPRMIVLPGLPDQFFMLLPTIGKSLGSFIGCVGALDPDANLESARASMPKGWESAACSATPSWAVGTARIAVMMPPEAKLPAAIQLQLRPGVSKRQEIYEEGAAAASRNRRKRAAAAAASSAGESAKKRRR